MTTDELYAASRAAFASYAAMDAPFFPEDTLSALQVRLCRWQNQNFGAQPEYRFVLGIVEEVGELYEALAKMDEPAITDAIGDTLVFATQLATCARLDIGVILTRPASIESSRDELPRTLGRLCHATLKMEQKVRGFDDPEKYRRYVFDQLLHLYWAMLSNTTSRTPLVGSYRVTAEKVLLRNWRVDPSGRTA